MICLTAILIAKYLRKYVQVKDGSSGFKLHSYVIFGLRHHFSYFVAFFILKDSALNPFCLIGPSMLSMTNS
jgi:hypothetical protein